MASDLAVDVSMKSPHTHALIPCFSTGVYGLGYCNKTLAVSFIHHVTAGTLSHGSVKLLLSLLDYGN